jgi:hypothetical protein
MPLLNDRPPIQPPSILHLAHFHSPRQDPVHPMQRHAPQHSRNQLRPPIRRYSPPAPHNPNDRFPSKDEEPHSAAVRVRSDVMHVHRETLDVGRGLTDELQFDREDTGESVQVDFTPSGRRDRGGGGQ